MSDATPTIVEISPGAIPPEYEGEEEDDNPEEG
jgi:hypothetical protein